MKSIILCVNLQKIVKNKSKSHLDYFIYLV